MMETRKWPVTGEVLIPPADDSEPDLAVLRKAQQLARLTLFAIDGMLLDMEGSSIEDEDVQLIQLVAGSADRYASDALKRFSPKDDGEAPAPDADAGAGVIALRPRRGA